MSDWTPHRNQGETVFDYLMRLSEWAGEDEQRYNAALRVGKGVIAHASTHELKEYQRMRNEATSKG